MAVFAKIYKYRLLDKIIMTNKKRIYRWYLILAIIYSSLILMSAIAVLIPALLPFAIVIGYLSIFWILFTIVMFIIILVKKIERVALWIPILFLVNEIFIFVAAIIIVGLSVYPEIFGKVGTTVNPLIHPLLVAIFPVIILIISIKLISRK